MFKNLKKRTIKSIRENDFFKMYKEELLVIPLLLVAFYLINYLLITLFPEGQFFDFYSEIETIVSKILKFTITLWTAHLALAVSFPKVYKFLYKMILNFDDIPHEKKVEYTVQFILVFIIAAALIFGGR